MSSYFGIIVKEVRGAKNERGSERGRTLTHVLTGK